MSAVGWTRGEPIAAIVQQHVEESAMLRHVRSILVRAPHVSVQALHAFDRRLAAHLDGVAVAGTTGAELCRAALETPGLGEVFAVTVRALEDKDRTALERAFRLSEAVAPARPGFLSAFGWVEPGTLQGTVRDLLASRDAFARETGITACAMHRLDPGTALSDALRDPAVALRARALRTVGECGASALGTTCVAALADEDDACRFAAAYSCVLLGLGTRAAEPLMRLAAESKVYGKQAFRLLMMLLEPQQLHPVLSGLAREPAKIRVVIEGAGLAGDPHYVPWLIKQMADDTAARVAGEAFTFITGADLDTRKLDRAWPKGFEAGPSPDPDDPDVNMDPDEGLPWPDRKKVEQWWAAAGGRFEKGTRYFMGNRVTREQCLRVLTDGCQRQRIVAAHHLCLLNPGTPLFNTSAPAWRQQKLLAQMS